MITFFLIIRELSNDPFYIDKHFSFFKSVLLLFNLFKTSEYSKIILGQCTATVSFKKSICYLKLHVKNCVLLFVSMATKEWLPVVLPIRYLLMLISAIYG